MKRFVTILMALLVLGVGLCGCGETNTQTSVTTPTTKPTEDPVEMRKEKLEAAYMEYCVLYGTGTVNFSGDRSSLTIDTNPDDTSYYSDSEEAKRIQMILSVNEYLGLPASIKEKMSSTRALDGLQTQNCGDYTVSWTYHPDNGLRVIYEVNFS